MKRRPQIADGAVEAAPRLADSPYSKLEREIAWLKTDVADLKQQIAELRDRIVRPVTHWK